MRVLLTNVDGPPNDTASPYIRHFVNYVLHYTSWDLKICIPNDGQDWDTKGFHPDPRASFIYTPTDAEKNHFLGPFTFPQRDKKTFTGLPDVDEEPAKRIPDDYTEWCLIENGSSATCADIGLNHLMNDYEFDLVISGPNKLRCSPGNLALSTRDLMSINGYRTYRIKAITLSWCHFDEIDVSDKQFNEISSKSVQLIKHLYDEWDSRVELYNITIPIKESLEGAKAMYTASDNTQRRSNYAGVKSVHETVDNCHRTILMFESGTSLTTGEKENIDPEGRALDLDVVENGNISVTPLVANTHYLDELAGEISLRGAKENCAVITIPQTDYVYKHIFNALKKHIPDLHFLDYLPADGGKIFHYGDYEQLDFDRLLTGKNYHANSYIYRKSLIRKHYLAHTIHYHVVKNPTSILVDAYLESFNINVDYAEFLDDALTENWDVRTELEKEDSWWILKPSMSDKGQGIRVFKTIDQLQEIFDSFEEDETDDENYSMDNNKVVTSQLRDFIIQRYLANPLQLPSMENRKFHIRCYVTCNGDLQVNVYNRMLALFAPSPFKSPSDDYEVNDVDKLSCHLTNTCLQSSSENVSNSVHEFDQLPDLSVTDKQDIKKQIHKIVSELFLAAVNLNRLHFQPLPNCFETYGLDFLVDANLRVKILEVNAFPDFKQTGDSLKDLIEELFDNIVSHCVKPFFGLSPSKTEDFVTVLDHSSNDW
ncbi:HBL161Wp [Eremothecium sinecaudum]|uniref:HBL161Wp n=1 Tax=Eremothecium sinecaudum TaxID=45286 RepID=A0A125RDW1_9SACH|nr:HBL161Wp [Eremothecium sinecaudum]AMD18741.1 HBL161Wp [Eremothecium sinecaudum]